MAKNYKCPILHTWYPLINYRDYNNEIKDYSLVKLSPQSSPKKEFVIKFKVLL